MGEESCGFTDCVVREMLEYYGLSEQFQETAREEGDAPRVEKKFGGYLSRTISIRDTDVRKEMQSDDGRRI